MDRIKIHIRDKYELSNYQIAQLAFVFKSSSSELSKTLIMGIVFHNHLKLYVFLLSSNVLFKNIFRRTSFLHIQKVSASIYHIHGNYHFHFFKNITAFICTVAFINYVYYFLLHNRTSSL